MLSWFTVETRDAKRVLQEMMTEQEVMRTQMNMLLKESQGGVKVDCRSVERSRAVSGIIPLISKKAFEELHTQNYKKKW